MIGRALMIAGLLTPMAVQAVAQAAPEQVIVEVALGRLTAATMTAYRIGDRLLLPAAELFGLAEIRVVGDSAGRLQAVIEPGARGLTVDVGTRRVIVGRETVALGHDDGREVAGILYLSSGLVGRLLGLEWSVNWADLTATVVDPTSLPIARRLDREWRRRSELAARGGAGVVADRVIDADRPTIDGAVLDYNVFAPTTGRLNETSFAAALGLDVLGGSFTASLQNQSSGGVRSDLAWAGVWRDRRWLTQLRLGDGLSSGPAPRTVRGISLGNSPFLRPNTLGETTFRGQLGPGWQVEAYRGGRLIGLDTVNALGRYAIDAPIAYGENPVEFIAYGPFGEVRRFHRTHRVDQNRIPARRLEYGAALGQCRTDRCRATANVDLRYGLSTNWTARAGLDQFWRSDSLGALFHPYAGVSGTVANAVGIELDAVADAVARATVRYEPATSLMVSAEASRFARGIRAPILSTDGRTSQLTVNGVYYPTDRLSSLFVEGGLDFIETTAGSFSSGRLGLSFQRGPLQLLPAVRWQRGTVPGVSTLQRQTAFSLNSYLLPIPRLGPFLGQVTARTTMEVTSSLAPVVLSGYASRNLGPQIRLEIGGGWSRYQGATASLTLAANLAQVRSMTTMSRSAGATTGSQFIQGSVLYSRQAGRIDLAAGPSLERSGVRGRVFLDRNGNERFDGDDDLLPNVRVTVGMETRVSDRRGEYHLWNMAPHEPAIIGIDSTTLESPLWVPSHRAVSLEPSPNRYRIVDLPIAPGGVIEGRVVSAADSTGVAGAELLLIERKTGVVRRLTSFSDGDFYIMGVKPGDYQLAVDPVYLARRGLGALPMPVTVPAAADGATIGGLVIRVVR